MFLLELKRQSWLTVFLVNMQSGKLVTKMFQKIQQLIDDKDALVFVLIDEVNKSSFINPITLLCSFYFTFLLFLVESPQMFTDFSILIMRFNKSECEPCYVC